MTKPNEPTKKEVKGKLADMKTPEPIDWKDLKQKELERWEQQMPLLQQEFARQLGIHEGRITVFDDRIKEEEGIDEDEQP